MMFLVASLSHLGTTFYSVYLQVLQKRRRYLLCLEGLWGWGWNPQTLGPAIQCVVDMMPALLCHRQWITRAWSVEKELRHSRWEPLSVFPFQHCALHLVIQRMQKCKALSAGVYSIGQADRVQDPQVPNSEDRYPQAYFPIYHMWLDG